jgi:hypothetical protein
MLSVSNLAHGWHSLCLPLSFSLLVLKQQLALNIDTGRGKEYHSLQSPPSHSLFSPHLIQCKDQSYGSTGVMTWPVMCDNRMTIGCLRFVIHQQQQLDCKNLEAELRLNGPSEADSTVRQGRRYGLFRKPEMILKHVTVLLFITESPPCSLHLVL